MAGPPTLKGWLNFVRARSFLLAPTHAAITRLDEVSPAALILGAAFVALEVYFFATLLRAWVKDRRARAASNGGPLIGWDR